MQVLEAYQRVECPVNAATPFNPSRGIIGGFVASVAGSIQITVGGTVVIPTQPVAVGWNALPFNVGTGAGVCTTSGGAVGILAVG